MMDSKTLLHLTAATIMAFGVAGCMTGSDSGGAGGGRYVEAFDPTGSALAAAFRRPTPEAGAEAALAEHVRTAAFLEQYSTTRQKAGCPDRGVCAHRLILVHVNGQGKPVGDPPSCAEISAQLDRQSGGQVAVRGVTWVRRVGPCAA